MMEIDQLAALRTTLDFHLLLTQSNPPARISLPPLWIAPPCTPQFEKRQDTQNTSPDAPSGKIHIYDTAA
jgi:hypothetical protein